MNVALIVGDLQQRSFFVSFEGASNQIAVEFPAHEFLYSFRWKVMLHHHERGVFSQTLHGHSGAFRISSDHLMSPPLMRNFMRGDKKRQIKLVRTLLHASNKANGFGIGNGIGKRFGESLITGVFNNPELMKLKGTETLSAVVESSFHAARHVIQIVDMAGIIVDFKVHIAPMIAQDLIASRVD